MQYELSFDSFTEIPFTSGTIQNINSQATVEVSTTDTPNTGIILYPGEKYEWSDATIYARAAWGNGETVMVAAETLVAGSGGGGGGSYTLPIATKTVLGGVKSSDTVGKVTVNNDGTMTYNPLGYRQPSTAYTAGKIAYHASLPTGWCLECITAGTTGSGDLTISSPAIGNTVTDGTVTWKIGMPLSLNGGTMTGSILHKDSEWFNIYGGQSSTVASGIIQLGSPAVDGRVNIIAKGADSTGELLAYPDGRLKWNGNDIVALYPNAAAHNSIYRGKDLTAYMNSGGMSTAIANGTFTDIYPGDYVIKSVTIDGTTYSDVRWYVVDLNYFIDKGYDRITTNHVVLMPLNRLGTAKMNATHTAENGYKGSDMWTTVIPKYVTGIETAFGASHVLSHQELLTSAVDNSVVSTGYGGWTGASSSWSWETVKVNLPNELMVYGAKICSSSHNDVGECTRQLSAFSLNPYFLINNERKTWWMRAVALSSAFCTSDGSGAASYSGAAQELGIRPYFLYY
jgi:hypothetical protein